MLLKEEVSSLCQIGRLVLHRPAIPGLRQRRKLYITKLLHDLLTTGPWSDAKDEVRWGELRYWCDRFTDGERIYVRERPRAKKSTASMAQLEPWDNEIWEIRSIDPKPSIRVFGSFVEKDEFVGLTWHFRKELNGYGGPKWMAAIQAYKTEWANFFTCGPKAGEYPNDYLSEVFVLD
jgi:hypothetical protein